MILVIVVLFVVLALGSFIVFLLISGAQAENRKIYHAAETIVREELLAWSIRNPYTMKQGEQAPASKRLMIGLKAISERQKQQSVFDLKQPIYIGRGNNCQVILYDVRISEKHACIFYEKGKVWIRNLTNSSIIRLKRGSFSRRVVKPGKTQMVHDGEIIRLNRSALKVQLFVYSRDHQ